MNVVDNIINALMNTPALTLILLNSVILLGAIGIVILSKRPNRKVQMLFGLIVLMNIILAVPLAIDMFFK